MTAAPPRHDARSMAWQFVAPTGAPEMLVVAEPNDSGNGAVTVANADLARYLRAVGWPAVAAPDLGAAVAGTRRRERGSATR